MNNKAFSPEPGLRVRNLREDLGLTRAQFNEDTGFSASTLRSIEVGASRMSVSQAKMLSHMFVLLYEQDPEIAGLDVLLYGEKREFQKNTKQPSQINIA